MENECEVKQGQWEEGEFIKQMSIGVSAPNKLNELFGKKIEADEILNVLKKYLLDQYNTNLQMNEPCTVEAKSNDSRFDLFYGIDSESP